MTPYDTATPAQVSPYIYNSPAEVALLLEALRGAVEELPGHSKL